MKINKTSKSIIKISISLIISLISFAVFVSSLKIEEENFEYAYNVDENMDYSVYLKPNNFIEEKYLPKDNAYIASIVDYININYNYDFSASNYANIKYSYDVIATLFIDYSTTNRNLIEKQYKIIENKTLEQNNQNKINITENINIDYNFYNNEVNLFKEQYNLPVTAYLKVDFIINSNIKYDKNEAPIVQKSVMETNIELNKQVFEITESKIGDDSKEIDAENSPEKYKIIISLLVFAISGVYASKQFEKSKFSQEYLHRLEVKRIIKKYGEVIIELLEEPKLKDYKIIYVKDFYELLDMEEEVRKPILEYKLKNDKEVFIIIDDKIVYRFDT